MQLKIFFVGIYEMLRKNASEIFSALIKLLFNQPLFYAPLSYHFCPDLI